MLQDRGGGLERVSLAPVRGQQGEADVDVRERVALQKPAEADPGPVGLLLRHVEPEAEPLVARDRAVENVCARVVERAHALVADEAQPRRLVQEAENELGIVDGDLAHFEAFGFENFHGATPRTFSIA